VDQKVLINLLVELAGLEAEQAMARHTIVRHATREKDLRELQAEYEEAAARAEQGDQETHLSLRAKEGEIEALTVLLAHKEDQIIGVSDRRQYRALQTEIAGLRQKLSDLEDEALALLNSTETASAGRAEALRDRDAQSARGGEEIVRLDGEAERASAAATELAAKIARCVQMLPAEIRRQVVRLQQNGGPAAVRVQSGACGGCFGQLPAQQAIDADKGRALVKCASCARFVVHQTWR
jgi:predicted  nucleic acid-binding Zn-ribbon protein